MSNKDLIEKAKKRALEGGILDRETIIRLLQIDPDSEDCNLLGDAAREVASVLCGDRAYLWAAIGIDSRPCPMNCDFCSLGEEWGMMTEESELTVDQVLDCVRQFAEQGVRWIVLRTTQFYSQQKLMELAAKIKREVPGQYELGLNIGEFGLEDARKMEAAGLEFVYHSLRLGEGKNTRFKPEERLATLRAVKDSPLKLVFLAEPIGAEHTNDEIADAFLVAMKHGALVTGAMARIPVPGTPLGALPQVSERRLAQIIAVTRLAAGREAPDICVHPASELAMNWGANVTVVERGAIPRDSSCNSDEDWKGFTPSVATKWFEAAGYNVFSQEEKK